MRGQCLFPQDRFSEHGGDKSQPWLQMASQASLCLPLTACWSFLPPCSCPFNLEHGGSLQISSAIPLLPEGSFLNHSFCLALSPGQDMPFCQNVLPNTFFCASWPLKEQNPWERNPERNSGFEKYRTKLLQVSIFETNLFVMMVCLRTDSLDFQQPSNPHVGSISCCWVSSVLCSNSVLFRSSPSGNSRLTQGCL